jgi:hypothetical protein
MSARHPELGGQHRHHPDDQHRHHLRGQYRDPDQGGQHHDPDPGGQHHDPDPGGQRHDPGQGGQYRDPLFVRVVLTLYPQRWRDRYGDEFAALLIDMSSAARWPARIGFIVEAASRALDAHLNTSFPNGERLMPNRIRRAVATVACAVIVFIIAGFGFEKMIEDPAYHVAARQHAAVGTSFDILRVAAILAGIAVLAGALPLAWSVIRQAVTSRRADLIKLLLIPPAAVIGWLAVVEIIVALDRHPRVHSAANLAIVALVVVLGLAAAVACAWATVAILRRADLAPGLLRPEIVPMAVLSVCMAVVTGADLSWGLAIRSADSTLFHSDNGLIATPMPPSWIAGVLVLAAATVVTAASTVRAARDLHTPVIRDGDEATA